MPSVYRARGHVQIRWTWWAPPPHYKYVRYVDPERGAELVTNLGRWVNELQGLSSTVAGKYDDLKERLSAELEASVAVCYVSDLTKQWTARVGQAVMGLPSLLLLLIEGDSEKDVVRRLERLHSYMTGLEATLVFGGAEGSWNLNVVVGTPGRSAFDLLRTVVPTAANAGTNGRAGTNSERPMPRVRTARSDGRFFELEPDVQAQHVWGTLIGEGPLEVEDAIRHAAHALRKQGLLDFERLAADGLVASEIRDAMSYATRRGFFFDRPRRGFIRAVKSDPDDFTREDWRQCIISALTTDQWVLRDDLVQSAARHAIDFYGLDMVRLRSGGRVDTVIRSAINGLIRLGTLHRQGMDQLKKAGDDASAAPIPTTVSTDGVKAPGGTEARADAPLPDSVSDRRDQSPERLRMLVGHIPPECEDAFKRLLAAPLREPTGLIAMVENHLRVFEEAFERQEFLDIDGAERLAAQSKELLGEWDTMSPQQHHLAQAAILYFVMSEEADDDFAIDGLRTDKSIMAAVLDAIAAF